MFLSLLAAPALGCSPTTVSEVAAVETPAIVVLGERHGIVADLRNATEVVSALAERTTVTLALEAVAEGEQSVLDQLSAGEIRARQLKRRTRWGESWGHDFRAYRQILAVPGVAFVAAGPPLGPLPEGEEVQVPPQYADTLREVVLAHGMPEEAIPAFSAAQAWRDLRIAELALQGWSGDGVLVIVTGRGHVAMGLGIPWQLAEGLSDVPTTTALLAPADDCGPTDRYLE